MLPVKKAKEHCGYEEKPTFPICSNCGAFASDMVLPAWMAERMKSGQTKFTIEENGVEKNMRCTDHNFAVKKTATCKLWRAKVKA